MIVVDTGPIVALLNDRDDHHVRCRDFLAPLPWPVAVPSTVFTEVCMLAEHEQRGQDDHIVDGDAQKGDHRARQHKCRHR